MMAEDNVSTTGLCLLRSSYSYYQDIRSYYEVQPFINVISKKIPQIITSLSQFNPILFQETNSIWNNIFHSTLQLVCTSSMLESGSSSFKFQSKIDCAKNFGNILNIVLRS